MSDTGRAVIVVLENEGLTSIRTPGILTCEDPAMGSYVVTRNSGQWIDTSVQDNLFKIEPSLWTDTHDELGLRLGISEGQPQQGANH